MQQSVILSHLVPTSTVDLLFTMAVLAVASCVVALCAVIVVPQLYREMRTWLPAGKVIDFDARRREIAAPGIKRTRVGR